MNQFFVTAIAEKVSALKTEAFIRDRQAKGQSADFDAWMALSPRVIPLEGDELSAP